MTVSITNEYDFPRETAISGSKTELTVKTPRTQRKSRFPDYNLLMFIAKGMDQMMRFELQEIDEIYRSIEVYIEPSSVDEIINTAQRDGTNFSRNREEAHAKYDLAIQKFGMIADYLSPEDIIQGYHEGSILLRLNLVGSIWEAYNPIYLPLIIQAIREKHKGADRLLAALPENMSITDLQPVLIEALNSGVKRLEEMALNITRHFKFVEMRSSLEAFLDKHPEKSDEIQGLLEELSSSEPPTD